MTAGRTFDAALFDMDGLLVDSEPLWREAEIAVFGRHGLELTDEQCRSTQGMVILEVARHWYERAPWPGAGPDDVAQEVLEAVGELIDRRAVLMPGVHAALDDCRGRGMRLALASSSPRQLIDRVVARLELGDAFEAVCSAQDELAGKPDPAVFLRAARSVGVPPARCVVFEDAPAGVRAAKAAGMVCVAVPERPAHPAFADADVVLRSMEDLDDGVWERLAVAAAAAAGDAGPTGSRRGPGQVT
jgi:sugar-phosphatase